VLVLERGVGHGLPVAVPPPHVVGGDASGHAWHGLDAEELGLVVVGHETRGGQLGGAATRHLELDAGLDCEEPERALQQTRYPVDILVVDEVHPHHAGVDAEALRHAHEAGVDVEGAHVQRLHVTLDSGTLAYLVPSMVAK
jgi:hypothetical protein